MNKRLVSIIILLFMLFSFNPLIANAEVDLKVNAKSAVLIDVKTGTIIYKLNENERLAPASITKIMTMLLGLEAIESGKIQLTDEIRVSKRASGTGGSTVFLQEGETQTVENLFRAIAIRSANDAAVALAEHIAGSEELFVKQMNERAKELGMENTEFYNSNGLPNDNHYVSAYDVALMSRELLKHEVAHEWLTTYMDEMLVGKNKNSNQVMVNTNRLIKEYQGATGIKTGSTNEAGFCLSGSAKRGDLELIAVVMGSSNSKVRFDEVKRMLDYGFATYDSMTIGNKGDLVAVIPVEKGKIENIEVIFNKDVNILIEKGKESKVEQEIVLPEKIQSPVYEGDKIGELILKMDDNIIETVDLVSQDTVEKANVMNILKKTIKSYFEGR